MKSFAKMFVKALPLALGIILALISVAFTVNVTETAEAIPPAIISGLIGYPLLIASVTSLTKESTNM